jgi:excisionase family DNA binding protein
MKAELHTRLAELYRELAEVHRQLADSDDGEYFDQRNSPLGRRLHCRLARSGELPAYRSGRSILIKRSDVARYLEKHRVEPTAPVVGTQDEDEALLSQAGLGTGKAA